MDWIDELEKAVRRAPEMDEETAGGEEDEQEEGEMGKCPPVMTKSTKPAYAPADNGDDDTDGDVGVHDADSLETANSNTGKKQKVYPKTNSGVKKSLTDESAAAIEVSDVLGDLTKGIDTLVAAQAAQITELRAEVAGLTKGLAVIGKALGKSLSQTDALVKGLTQQVEQIGRQPAGRKSTVRAIEKSFAGSGEEQKPFPDKATRMAKSMKAVIDGKITPVDASAFESACNRGEFRQDLWRKMGGE